MAVYRPTHRDQKTKSRSSRGNQIMWIFRHLTGRFQPSSQVLGIGDIIDGQQGNSVRKLVRGNSAAKPELRHGEMARPLLLLIGHCEDCFSQPLAERRVVAELLEQLCIILQHGRHDAR